MFACDELAEYQSAQRNRIAACTTFELSLGACPVRGVAQPGSASVLGTEGRRFESCLPDHFTFRRVSERTELGVTPPTAHHHSESVSALLDRQYAGAFHQLNRGSSPILRLSLP